MSRLLAIFAFLAYFTSSCATLMYNQTDVSGPETLGLKKGDDVKLAISFEEEAGAAIDERVGRKNFKSMMAQRIKAVLAEEGIKVSKESKNSVSIKITEFDQGTHFARAIGLSGWFGGSYLTGHVDLRYGQKTRKFELKKVGQKGGVFNIADQTVENIDYFAQKLAGSLMP